MFASQGAIERRSAFDQPRTSTLHISAPKCQERCQSEVARFPGSAGQPQRIREGPRTLLRITGQKL
jgi:hypothetical protein